MYLHLFFLPACHALAKNSTLTSTYLNVTKDLNLDYWTGLYLLTILAVFTLGVFCCLTWCCCCSETEYEEAITPLKKMHTTFGSKTSGHGFSEEDGWFEEEEESRSLI